MQYEKQSWSVDTTHWHPVDFLSDGPTDASLTAEKFNSALACLEHVWIDFIDVRYNCKITLTYTTIYSHAYTNDRKGTYTCVQFQHRLHETSIYGPTIQPVTLIDSTSYESWPQHARLPRNHTNHTNILRTHEPSSHFTTASGLKHNYFDTLRSLDSDFCIIINYNTGTSSKVEYRVNASGHKKLSSL